MNQEEYIKHKWQKLFQFMNNGNSDIMTMATYMEMPCAQIKLGNVEEGAKLAEAFKQHWDRVLKEAGICKKLLAVKQDDWVKGHAVVSQTDWYFSVFRPIITAGYFESMDTNRDDKISLDEWRLYYNTHHIYEEDFIQSTFHKMDANGDGVITRDEFHKANHIFDTRHEPGNDFSFLYMRN